MDIEKSLEARRPVQCTCSGQHSFICELRKAVEGNVITEDQAQAVYAVNYDPDCPGMVASNNRPGECQPAIECGHGFGKDYLGILAIRVSRMGGTQ